MPQTIAPIDTLVFDLDGTLIDSAGDIRAALNITLAQYNREALPLDRVISMIGDGAPRLLERAFQATGAPLAQTNLPTILAGFIDVYEKIVPPLDCLYPGVMDTLAAFKSAGYGMGICTNKPQAPTDQVLASLGISTLVPVAIGGDALPVRKPDPAHLRAVISRLGADPDRTVMVGDSAADINVARNAGIRAVAVSYGYPRMPVSALGADIIIDHFSDLPAALESLSQQP